MDPEVTNAKEEIIMKKILSMILTAIMLVSLAAPALATEIPTDVTVPEGYRLQRGLVVNEKIPYEAVENMEDAAIRVGARLRRIICKVFQLTSRQATSVDQQ